MRASGAVHLGMMLALLSAPSMLRANDAPEPGVPGLRMAVVFLGADPLGTAGSTAYHAEIGATVDALRAEFTVVGGRRFTLLQPAGSHTSWLVDSASGALMPFQGEGLRGLFVDPGDPCASVGGRCRALPERRFGEIRATAWRYRNATRGPGGTREGTLWVDPDRAIIVAYEGRVGREERSMHPLELTHETIAAESFEPPAGAPTAPAPPR